MSDFSDKLKQLRGPSSQAEMARQLGMKQPQWARYESGASSPSIAVLAMICRVHAVSADWLLGLNDKSSHGENNSARAGSGGIAIAGSGNSVTGVVAPNTKHQAPSTTCAKCPYKKKLKALEKLIQK